MKGEKKFVFSFSIVWFLGQKQVETLKECMSWVAWFWRRMSPSNGSRCQVIKPLGPRDYASYWCRWRRCGSRGAALVKWHRSVPWPSILFRCVGLYIAACQSISHEFLHVHPAAAAIMASLLADVLTDSRWHTFTSVITPLFAWSDSRIQTAIPHVAL